MYGQPDGLHLRVCPGDAVALAGGDHNVIAGSHTERDGVFVEKEVCLSGEKQDPFIPLLIIPLTFGRCLTLGYDPLYANPAIIRQRLEYLIGQTVGEICKNVVQCMRLLKHLQYFPPNGKREEGERDSCPQHECDKVRLQVMVDCYNACCNHRRHGRLEQCHAHGFVN